MTDVEALKEYELALGYLLIYWNAPETNQDPHRWGRVLDRETESLAGALQPQAHRQPALLDAVMNAHRSANVFRMQRYQR